MGKKDFTSQRLILIGVILLILSVAGVTALRGRSVLAFPVARRDLLQTVVTTGRVTLLAKVEVGSQIVGSVSQVLVDSGDRVRQGDLLIRLRDDEARAALAQAESVVHELDERLKQIGAVDSPVSQQKVAEAETALRHAQTTYERVRKLHDDGISSRADLDEAIRARDVAESVVARERLQRSNSIPQGSEIRLAEARLAQARAAVGVARERLARTVITAPGDGTVIYRKVEAGDVVQPGQTLMVLSRNGRTQITAQVDEKNLGLLNAGQPALVSADAYPDRSFPARLVTVVPAVDPLRGTFEARCDVAEPPPYLVPDMTVSLEIEVARLPMVLTVPTETIRDAATTPWVLVARDGRAVRQDVTLGIRGSGASEVKSGLKQGEMVLPAAGRVAEGDRIRVRPAAGGS